MQMSRWIVRRGREGAWRYLRVSASAGVTWVASEAEAERFDTKGDALALAEPIAAGLAVAVAVYPLDGSPRD